MLVAAWWSAIRRVLDEGDEAGLLTRGWTTRMATGSPSSVVALTSGPVALWVQLEIAAFQVFTRGQVGSTGAAELIQIVTWPGPVAEGGFSAISSPMSLPLEVQALMAHTASTQARRRMTPPGGCSASL